EIDNILRQYYLKTYSARRTAAVTGFNRKTVSKRFNRWEREAIAAFDEKLNRGDMQFQIEYIHLNQVLIDEQLDLLDEIKTYTANARASNDGSLSHLIANRIQVTKALQVLNEKRLAVKIYPSATRVVDKIFKKKMGDYVQLSAAN
ncbi:MAG: hypothetical protein ACREBJ_05985, partial [Nitrosotalea sp.]